jgi:hypothetical protein
MQPENFLPKIIIMGNKRTQVIVNRYYDYIYDYNDIDKNECNSDSDWYDEFDCGCFKYGGDGCPSCTGVY